MSKFLEMTLWSTDQIEAEIREILPSGHRFHTGWDEEHRVWYFRFETETDSGEWVTVEEEVAMDQKVALFTAYGWVWLQRAVPDHDSPWVRRQEVTKERVTQRVNAPDPEDLVPDEIASVYANRRRR